MNTTIKARLDKRGERVLCGRQGCGCELARIVTIPGAVYSATGAPLSTTGDTRYVQFGPGWQHNEDGLWALSKGARKSWTIDHRLAAGNALTWQVRAESARSRLATGKTTGNKRPVANPYTGELNQVRNGAELPAFTRCPDCSGIVELSGDALNATSRPTG